MPALPEHQVLRAVLILMRMNSKGWLLLAVTLSALASPFFVEGPAVEEFQQPKTPATLLHGLPEVEQGLSINGVRLERAMFREDLEALPCLLGGFESLGDSIKSSLPGTAWNVYGDPRNHFDQTTFIQFGRHSQVTAVAGRHLFLGQRLLLPDDIEDVLGPPSWSEIGCVDKTLRASYAAHQLKVQITPFDGQPYYVLGQAFSPTPSEDHVWPSADIERNHNGRSAATHFTHNPPAIVGEGHHQKPAAVFQFSDQGKEALQPEQPQADRGR